MTPKPGLNAGDVNRIEMAAAYVSGVERYFGIVFDKMEISSGLFSDMTSGDLIGYTDLDDPLYDFISSAKLTVCLCRQKRIPCCHFCKCDASSNCKNPQ